MKKHVESNTSMQVDVQDPKSLYTQMTMYHRTLNHLDPAPRPWEAGSGNNTCSTERVHRFVQAANQMSKPRPFPKSRCLFLYPPLTGLAGSEKLDLPGAKFRKTVKSNREKAANRASQVARTQLARGFCTPLYIALFFVFFFGQPGPKKRSGGAR